VKCWVIENNYYICLSLFWEMKRNIALVSPKCLIFMLIWPHFIQSLLSQQCKYLQSIYNWVSMRTCSDYNQMPVIWTVKLLWQIRQNVACISCMAVKLMTNIFVVKFDSCYTFSKKILHHYVLGPNDHD
jgi:hypothetical protein